MSPLKMITIFGITTMGMAMAFFAGENLRGEAAWKDFKKEWEAKGTTFDYLKSVPPTVPSEKNFAHTPLLKPLLEHQWNATSTEVIQHPPKKKTARATQLMAMKDVPPSFGQWRLGKRADLVQWQQFFRKQKDWPHPENAGAPGADILHALKKYDAELNELATAMRERPACRFDIQYEATFGALLPHLTVLRSAARGTTLRALAHLSEGQTDDALADVQLTLNLSECLATEPMLISQLVRIAIQEMALQLIWEGLADGKWQAKHLAALEKNLASIKMLAGFGRAMNLERNAANFMFVNMLENGKPIWNQVEALGGDIPKGGLNMAPKGWLYQNLVNLNRMHLTYTHNLIDAKSGRVHPGVALKFDEAVNNMKRSPFNILSALLMPSLYKVAQRTGASQSSVDLALLSVQLEQHKIKHGSYPRKLSVLKGAAPKDPYSGKAYQYRVTDGRYSLYGLGWNGKNDSGKVPVNAKRANLEKGDIVWRLPAPERK